MTFSADLEWKRSLMWIWASKIGVQGEQSDNHPAMLDQVDLKPSNTSRSRLCKVAAEMDTV